MRIKESLLRKIIREELDSLEKRQRFPSVKLTTKGRSEIYPGDEFNDDDSGLWLTRPGDAWDIDDSEDVMDLPPHQLLYDDEGIL